MEGKLKDAPAPRAQSSFGEIYSALRAFFSDGRELYSDVRASFSKRRENFSDGGEKSSEFRAIFLKLRAFARKSEKTSRPAL
jgi:hypothetical protein